MDSSTDTTRRCAEVRPTWYETRRGIIQHAVELIQGRKESGGPAFGDLLDFFEDNPVDGDAKAESFVGAVREANDRHIAAAASVPAIPAWIASPSTPEDVSRAIPELLTVLGQVISVQRQLAKLDDDLYTCASTQGWAHSSRICDEALMEALDDTRGVEQCSSAALRELEFCEITLRLAQRLPPDEGDAAAWPTAGAASAAGPEPTATNAISSGPGA